MLSELQLLKLSGGRRIEIIKSLTPVWKEFGIQLNFDPLGKMIDCVCATHSSSPEECCRKVLQHWLKGNGEQPATWRTLICVLRDIQQGKLAHDLQEML